MTKAPHGRAGMTLIEVALTLSILGGVGGTLFLATQSLTSAFRTGSILSTLDSQTREGLDRVADLLEQAGNGTLDPPSSDPFLGGDVIVFQRVLGFEAGSIQYSAPERIRLEPSPLDPEDGLDNDGNGLVDDGEVVWIERDGQPDEERHVLVRRVARVAEGETAANGVDDNDNGITDEGGFSLAWDSASVTVRLTVRRRVSSAITTGRTFERTVAFLNGEN